MLLFVQTDLSLSALIAYSLKRQIAVQIVCINFAITTQYDIFYNCLVYLICADT